MSSAAISDAQLAANRANAQLSHGPVSEEGKAIASRNNFRHGLSVASDVDNFRVLGIESQDAYDQHLIEFRTEWQPDTPTEHDLVNRMVMHQWLRLRALRLQESTFDTASGEVSDVKKFDLYRRYETSHERGYNKAFGDLTRLRSFQIRQQNGFESQKRKNEEHELKIQRLKHKAEMYEIQILDKLAQVNLKIARTFSIAGNEEAREIALNSAQAYKDYFVAKQNA
jgi:hypothetical protein